MMKSKGKAFLLVGHGNWGKSWTLKAFTNNDNRIQYEEINKLNIFVRRMSNYDDPNGLLKFVRKIEEDYVIIAFCPNFEKKERKTREILDELWQKYNLYFFILKYKYGSDREISPIEIEILEDYGKVKVFDEKEDEVVRAREFRSFVELNII